jgi:hypothetical protein
VLRGLRELLVFRLEFVEFPADLLERLRRDFSERLVLGERLIDRGVSFRCSCSVSFATPPIFSTAAAATSAWRLMSTPAKPFAVRSSCCWTPFADTSNDFRPPLALPRAWFHLVKSA